MRERRENEKFHEIGESQLWRWKIFMKRAGEAAGESGNFHETKVELLAKVKIFMKRAGEAAGESGKFPWNECGIVGEGENFHEAGGSLLKKRECTLKIDGVVGKVEMHVKNCRGPVEKVGKFHKFGRILLK